MSEADRNEEAVFEAALQLRPAERVAYLDQTCAGDPRLRLRIESLLGALDRAGGRLSEPAVARSEASEVPSLPPTAKPGDRIGRYKLLQQIGEGGCGVVYMAEQEEPVRRRVALKVIKLGMDTQSVIARFEAERQALALMDHPNIARVLDAGATGTGRPYFVMELVRGIKITDYCDENNLPMPRRLELFIQVCQAIQHAHQKGIIHRDIKPSNILVTVNDGVPVPKVIDFGIAKATTGQPLTDKTLFTAFEQFIGTPAYMSPEQAVMTSVDIDTRSDIYSLGVLLYELLTGKTPFDTKELLQAGLDEMRRTIREVEPVKPSTRLTQARLADPSPDSAASALRIPHSAIADDLDWIVMKALEKDRTRRYETANGLAADLKRHLDNEPVVARPPSAGYRFQKLVRRNKLLFAAIGAVISALLLGLVVSTFLLVRERIAQRKARAELQKSQQVTTFLQGMLDDVSPELNQGRETKVRDILDRAVNRSSVELTNQPEIQALMLSTIAGVYDKLADFGKAETLSREALRLQESVVGPEHESIAELLDHLGLIQTQRGDLTGAATSLHRAVAMMKKYSRPGSPALVDALANLARMQLQNGDISGAEAALREALDLTSKVPAAARQGAVLRSHLGRVLWARGDAAGAESAFRQTLDLAAKLLPADHPLVATTLGNLGLVQWERGDLDAAEGTFRDASGRMIRILGNTPHPEVAVSLNNLALVLRDRGDLDGAETMQRQALDFMIKTVGPRHPDTGHARGNLAVILRRRGALSPAQARALFTEALQLNPNDEISSDALACHFARSNLTPLTPEASNSKSAWHYTSLLPATNWARPDFPDAGWASEPAPRGFSNWVPRSIRVASPRTNLWLRREFEISQVPTGTLAFLVGRNHDARIFVNGVENIPATDWSDAPVLRAWTSATRAALKPGRNVIAVLCQDADGNAPIEISPVVAADSSLGRDALIMELGRLVELDPQLGEAYAARGNALARSGRFAEAAQDLAQAAELLPADSTLRFQLAFVMLVADDAAGFRRVRAEVLGSIQKSVSPQNAERMARIALALPVEAAELEAAARLADQAAAADYPDGGLAAWQLAKAIADFRRSRFADAISWANKALASASRPDLPGWSYEQQRNLSAAARLVEAMAFHRTGSERESAAALNDGVRIIENQFPAMDSGDLGRAWPDMMLARMLGREAGQLIQKTNPNKVESP